MENVMKPTRESMVRDEEKYFLPRDGVIVVAGPSRFRHFPWRKEFRNV